jgi:uncharacterized protein with HEPN domain
VRTDRDYLTDMLKALRQVEKYAALGRARFQADELVQTFMIHQIQIMGEAARAVSEAVRVKTPEVEWPVIIGMRNRLVHGYFEIDVSRVWDTVELDLPKLRERIERLVKEDLI